ncbi:hypothetical protein O181_072061 [Austropuccinia psidii MF-1]|uniref:Uncharacterized protein n=1 Tax=Austropuccinia psidii MF-1 TaxID=1389203 RepID=A0A9Q3I730_9BASI|nr:hypothetical protein [Austropuccinia psidii MF-1]
MSLAQSLPHNTSVVTGVQSSPFFASPSPKPTYPTSTQPLSGGTSNPVTSNSSATRLTSQIIQPSPSPSTIASPLRNPNVTTPRPETSPTSDSVPNVGLSQNIPPSLPSNPAIKPISSPFSTPAAANNGLSASVVSILIASIIIFLFLLGGALLFLLLRRKKRAQAIAQEPDSSQVPQAPWLNRSLSESTKFSTNRTITKSMIRLKKKPASIASFGPGPNLENFQLGPRGTILPESEVYQSGITKTWASQDYNSFQQKKPSWGYLEKGTPAPRTPPEEITHIPLRYG